jgi:hypothetical protein
MWWECYTTLKIQSWPTAKHVSILVINPELVGEGILSHIKKIRYFPITPRLQRLFMSLKTVEHMTWHHSYDTMDKVIVHSSNGETWKHFNNVHPQLSVESRNMRLGLCILDSIHLGHLLLPILVGRLYSQFTTCYKPRTGRGRNLVPHKKN